MGTTRQPERFLRRALGLPPQAPLYRQDIFSTSQATPEEIRQGWLAWHQEGWRGRVAKHIARKCDLDAEVWGRFKPWPLGRRRHPYKHFWHWIERCQSLTWTAWNVPELGKEAENVDGYLTATLANGKTVNLGVLDIATEASTHFQHITWENGYPRDSNPEYHTSDFRVLYIDSIALTEPIIHQAILTYLAHHLEWKQGSRWAQSGALPSLTISMEWAKHHDDTTQTESLNRATEVEKTMAQKGLSKHAIELHQRFGIPVMDFSVGNKITLKSDYATLMSGWTGDIVAVNHDNISCVDTTGTVYTIPQAYLLAQQVYSQARTEQFTL